MTKTTEDEQARQSTRRPSRPGRKFVDKKQAVPRSASPSKISTRSVRALKSAATTAVGTNPNSNRRSALQKPAETGSSLGGARSAAESRSPANSSTVVSAESRRSSPTESKSANDRTGVQQTSSKTASNGAARRKTASSSRSTQVRGSETPKKMRKAARLGTKKPRSDQTQRAGASDTATRATSTASGMKRSAEAPILGLASVQAPTTAMPGEAGQRGGSASSSTIAQPAPPQEAVEAGLPASKQTPDDPATVTTIVASARVTTPFAAAMGAATAAATAVAATAASAMVLGATMLGMRRSESEEATPKPKEDAGKEDSSG